MMTALRGFTRRDWGRVFAALLLGRCFLRAGGGAPLTWADQPQPGAGFRRRYRADAQIVLLSIPVLHRKDVGDGEAIWRESAADGGAAIRLLEFTGRSAPERAAGLNRFGFIQELSRSGDRAHAESIYFGLMTSSPEENAAEARKALHSNSKDSSYSAIEGHISAGSIETASSRFIAPVWTSPAERNELVERARQALSGASKRKLELRSTEDPPRPFLHALAGLLDQPGASETRFAYNGRLYLLRVTRSADPKVAHFFREQRLISPTAEVTRISAWLCREEGGTPSEFRLWIEDGMPLPLRIEYQPKSYLRLAFEADAGPSGPTA